MSDAYSLQDTVMQARFREIVRDHKIKVIVETGIDKGLSTVVLAGMVDLVVSIDNNLDCFSHAHINLVKNNIRNVLLVCGSYPFVLGPLQQILPETPYTFWMHIGKITGLFWMRLKRFGRVLASLSFMT